MEKLKIIGGNKLSGSITCSGAKNAAILAVQILAIGDDSLKQKLSDYKVNMKKEVLAKDAKLNS